MLLRVDSSSVQNGLRHLAARFDAFASGPSGSKIGRGAALVLSLAVMCMGALLFPNAAYAAKDFKTPGGIQLTSSQNINCSFDQKKKILEINAYGNQTITLSGTSEGEAVSFFVPNGYGHVNLVFKDLSIDARSNSHAPAFGWGIGGTGCSVTLQLEGKNVLRSGSGFAGLQKADHKGAYGGPNHGWDPTTGAFHSVQGPEYDTYMPWLHITGNGELTAEGGAGGAGIGGGALEAGQTASTGYIAIGDVDGKTNPTVIAKGGGGAAGIGGGSGDDERVHGPFDKNDEPWGPRAQGVYILVRSGNVTATGGADFNRAGAGIGGGHGGRGENIWISGGTVNATGSGDDSGAPAIGGGSEGCGHNLFITGGTVHAIAPSIGGISSGNTMPCYPFGDGAWRVAPHFMDKPVMKITGGAIDLSGTWGASGRDGQHLQISRKDGNPVNAVVTGGIFGASNAKQGKTGVGKVYGCDVVANRIVLHNTDQRTKERFPWKVEEGTNEFAVSDGTAGTDYTYVNGVLRVISNKPLTIANRPGVSEAVSDRIVLGASVYFVTLDGVTIVRQEGVEGGAGAGVLVESVAHGTLVLGAPNVIKAGGNAAGLQVNEGGSLTIAAAPQFDSSNSIDAHGAGGGAGIGGARGKAPGSISISGGYIKARADGDGSALGSGWGGPAPTKPIALTGGYYSGSNSSEGTGKNGRVYGVSPYASKDMVYAVVRNTDSDTLAQYPFRVVPVDRVGTSLVIYGEELVKGHDWSYTDNVLAVKTPKPVSVMLAPDVEKSGTRITVEGTSGYKPAQVTLLKTVLDMEHVDEGAARANGGSAIRLGSPAHITLSGENEITAGEDGAAIANEGHALTIKGAGSLKARTSGNAAVIGGTADNPRAGNITIESGVISAEADGAHVAVIGSASKGGAMEQALNIVLAGGKFALSNKAQVEGEPLVGGAAGGASVSIQGGHFADKQGVPGGSGVGRVYGASPSAGYRIIKTADADLAGTYPYEAIADTRAFDVTGDDGAPAEEYSDYTYLDGVLRILTDEPLTIAPIDVNADAASDVIVVELPQAGGTAHLTIDSVKITAPRQTSKGGFSPIDLVQGGLDLTLAGQNALTSTVDPAIECNGGKLKISGDGELRAHSNPGEKRHPVIGTSSTTPADIEIAGGTLYVTQEKPKSSFAPSIGCTDYVKGAVKSIKITGGNISVDVPGHAKPIGSAESTENVKVSGGSFAVGSVDYNTVYDMVPILGYYVAQTDDPAFPYSVEERSGDLHVQGEGVSLGEGWEHDSTEQIVTVTTEKPVTVTMFDALMSPSSKPGYEDHTLYLLVIDPGEGKTAHVTLDGVRIDGRGASGAAIEVKSGSLELALAPGSNNSLVGCDFKPALHSGPHALSIASDANDPGTLRAQGGMLAAGIGGANTEGAHSISIAGGEIIAQGGFRAAGIGSGYASDDSEQSINIAISGGSIDARAGAAQDGGAEAIGSGEESVPSSVRITGGRFADQDAVTVESAEQRGHVYGVEPEDGHAVFQMDDDAYPAGVFALDQSAITQEFDEVPYTGEPVSLGDLAPSTSPDAVRTLALTWFDGNGAKLEDAPVNAGGYQVAATRGAQVVNGIGYLPVNQTFDFRIAPRQLAVAGALVMSREYDGTAAATATIELTGTVKEDAPTAVYDSATWGSAQAGECSYSIEGIRLEDASVNPVNANYVLSALDYSGTVASGEGIAKRSLDLGWVDSGRVVGDGKQVTAVERDPVTADLLAADGVSLVVTGGDANTAGDFTATVALQGDPKACENYELKSELSSYTYTVAPSTPAIVTVFDHADGVYTYGDEVRISGTVSASGAAPASGDALTTRDLTGEVVLHLGAAELARGEVAADGAYELAFGTLGKALPTGTHNDLEIEYLGSADVEAGRCPVRRMVLKKAPVTASVTGSVSKAYDGTTDAPAQAVQALALELTGQLGDDAPTAEVSCAFTRKDAGVIPLSVSVGLSGNWDAWYEVESVSNDVSGLITPRVAALAWAGTQQRVGDSISVTAAVSNSAPGDDVKVEVASSSSDVVGEHTARAVRLVGKDAANYRLESGSVSETTYWVEAAPSSGGGSSQGEGGTGGESQGGQGGQGGTGDTDHSGQGGSGQGGDSGQPGDPGGSGQAGQGDSGNGDQGGTPGGPGQGGSEGDSSGAGQGGQTPPSGDPGTSGGTSRPDGQGGSGPDSPHPAPSVPGPSVSQQSASAQPDASALPGTGEGDVSVLLLCAGAAALMLGAALKRGE